MRQCPCPPPQRIASPSCSPTTVECECHHKEGGAVHPHRGVDDMVPHRHSMLRGPPQRPLPSTLQLLVTLLFLLTQITTSSAFGTTYLVASQRSAFGRSSNAWIAPPDGGIGVVETVRLQAAAATIASPPTDERVRRSPKAQQAGRAEKTRRKSPNRTASAGKYGARNNIIPLNIDRGGGRSKAQRSKKRVVAPEKASPKGGAVRSPARAALYDRLWLRRYEELLAFRAVHGNCLVPHDDPNFKLSRWVRNQRRLYKSCSMPTGRIRRLDEVDFAWSTRGLSSMSTAVAAGAAGGSGTPSSSSSGGSASEVAPQAQATANGGSTYRYTPWSHRLDQLRQYKALHGDCNVPQHYEENPQLGRWVKAQRYHYQRMQRDRAKQKSSFTETKRTVQRVRELNALGFCWGAVGSPRKGRGGRGGGAASSRSSGDDDANKGCENGNDVHYRTDLDAQLHAHWQERFKALR